MIRNILFNLVFGTLLFASDSFAQERAIPSSKSEVILSFSPVVEKTAPAVVNIYTKRKVETNYGALSPLFDDPAFQMFFGDQLGRLGIPKERMVSSLGSGVIVRSNGLVVTNNHVVKDSDQIKVVLSDRREFDAKVVLTDQKSDLAFLKLEGSDGNLTAIEITDSDNAKVGDLVLAIGNPFGVGQTVTSGIISALSRTNVGSGAYHFFIQTDAAINPGNSGGALVTMDGKLVGINTAIYSKSGGSLGIGFAIPSNMLKAVMSSLENEGKIVRAWFGASMQNISSEMAESMGFKKPSGVIIKKVYPSGPADKAGIKVGDIVLGFENSEIADAEELNYRLATRQVGSEYTLGVFRDGKKIDIKLNAEAPPEKPKRDIREIKGENPFSGAKVANLSPAYASEIGMDLAATGVIISEVKSGSIAAKLGFMRGDIVLEINGINIDSTEKLSSAVSKKSIEWGLAINRDGEVIKTVIR